jgi:methylmalonyl-CoA/ethylmalonyl-CoA epimerase
VTIQELHHIGIAVRSIEEALPRYVDGLGLRLEGIEDVPSEKVKVAMVYAGRTRIELLEPTAPDSPVQKFLDRRGPGVHHLAFKVDDAQHDQGAHRWWRTTPGRGATDRRP